MRRHRNALGDFRNGMAERGEVSLEFVDNMSFMNELCLKLVQY